MSAKRTQNELVFECKCTRFTQKRAPSRSLRPEAKLMLAGGSETRDVPGQGENEPSRKIQKSWERTQGSRCKQRKSYFDVVQNELKTNWLLRAKCARLTLKRALSGAINFPGAQTGLKPPSREVKVPELTRSRLDARVPTHAIQISESSWGASPLALRRGSAFAAGIALLKAKC